MNIEESLKRMIHIAVSSAEADEAMRSIGFSSSPFFEIYGEAADAIFFLIGDRADRFENSVTYRAIHEEGLSEDERLAILMDEYKRNKGEVS